MIEKRLLIEITFDRKQADVKKKIKNLFNNNIKGKKIKDSDGNYYVVDKCKCDYVSRDSLNPLEDFYSVDVYLKDEKEAYELYADTSIENEIMSHFDFIKVEFSEDGMQRPGYINLDVVWDYSF